MYISSSSSSESDGGMDKLFMVLICDWPFGFFRKTSLYWIGRQGCSWWSLTVDIVEVVPSVSDEDSEILGDGSEVGSVELIEEDELSSDGHVVGDEGL